MHWGCLHWPVCVHEADIDWDSNDACNGELPDWMFSEKFHRAQLRDLPDGNMIPVYFYDQYRFHWFMDLPLELRREVWRHAVGPSPYANYFELDCFHLEENPDEYPGTATVSCSKPYYKCGCFFTKLIWDRTDWLHTVIP